MNSHEKGKRGEREFASLCREHGFVRERTLRFSFAAEAVLGRCRSGSSGSV